MEVKLPNNFTLRPRQANLWSYLSGGGRRASVCWHRRYGKDDVSMHWTAVAAHLRVGSYWHMLPLEKQARKAIWTQVNPHTGKKRIDEAFPPVLRAKTNDHEMFIEFKNGSTWQIAGSDNYDTLVGSSPCGIVFSEYALADPSAWAYLRPILRENKGWAIFLSTPRGENHFYRLHKHAFTEPGWFAETLTVEDTKLLSDTELQSDLRELQAEHGDQYGKSIWLQENYCSFTAAIPGSYWGESIDHLQKNGRIVDFPINPDAPVYTGWDLGRTDDTAIWFYQWNGDQIDVIDYFSQPGFEIDEPDRPDISLAHYLLKVRKQHSIKYATHWLPHDARPRRLGMGGKSILQQFNEAARKYEGLGQFALIQSKLDVQEGVQAARKTFQRVRFHATFCDLGISALRHYHREWDPELKKYNDTPVHDWSSHGADAWRYVSLSWNQSKQPKNEPHWHDGLMQSAKKGLTWGDVTQDHFARMRRLREERAIA